MPPREEHYRRLERMYNSAPTNEYFKPEIRITEGAAEVRLVVRMPAAPRSVQAPLPVWIAVGGTPASVVRAARLGLPMALAIIGGMPERFAPVVDLYRQTAREAGHDPATLPVSINSHAFVAADAKKAADVLYPAYAEVMTRIGRERGWPPLTRDQFEAGRTLRGALAVGSPEQVIEKILFQHDVRTSAAGARA